MTLLKRSTGKAFLASAAALTLMTVSAPLWAQDAPAPAPAADPVLAVQPPDGTEKPKGPDVIDKALTEPRLKRLVQAIKAADLVETLKGKGPFTVFAPVDSAFNKIPQAQWEELLKPENKAKLVELLKYHVVAGKLTSEDVAKLKDGDTIKTLSGGSILIHVTGNRIKLGDANLVKTDITVANGVIHQIDAVLVPAPAPAPPAEAPGAAPAPPAAPPAPN